ncbi:hypothetical protein FA13DRAFT_1801891 [Coprinellus micaceus]|uniref:60S ribosomal protein L31 n=1 Tax=Coprinellus micaceus TaxID=71717 RepID=A0A4Y7SDK5_COPMI|nr:hypothetical protein FA13DRAFT_1801891 [Coprinellus micaceus]
MAVVQRQCCTLSALPHHGRFINSLLLPATPTIPKSYSSRPPLKQALRNSIRVALWAGDKQCSALQDVVTRDYHIHLRKRVHGRSFKKRAPWAIKSIVDFTTKAMGATDVRIDPKLNQAVWAQGIKSVPHG